MKHTFKISVPYLGKAVVVSVVSFSCAISAYQLYQNTNIFSPSLQAASLKNNQVVFPGQDKQSLDQQNKSDDNYSKQKKDAKDQITPKNQSQSSFLFEQNNQLLNNNNPNLPTNNPITGRQNNNNVPTLDNSTLVINPNGTNDSNSSTTILVPGDTKNTLDSLMPENGQTNSSTGESNDHDSGSSSNSNKNNGSNSNSGSGETPSNPTEPDIANKYPDPVAKLPDISSNILYRDVISTSRAEFKSTDKNVSYKFEPIPIASETSVTNTSKIYYGKQLDAWTLLCNALFFVYEEDGTSGAILKKYRLTNFNENFEIGEFPEVATDNFSVVFRFRPDSSSPWQERTVDYTIEDNKLVFLDYNDNELTTYNLKNGKGDNENSTNEYFSLRYFYKYYLNNGNKSDTLKTKKIFQGWSTTPNGEPINDDYVKNAKGKVILYPLEMIDIPEQYEVELRYCFDQNEKIKYKYRYVLTDIKYDDITIKEDIHLPNYIERIDLQNEHNYDHEGKLYLPESLEKISINSHAYANYNDIIVDKNNSNMCSKNGLVLSKDKTTVIYSISSNMLTIPATVTKIEGISAWVYGLNFEDPTKIDSIKSLKNYEPINIFVDDQYYLDCYKRWYEDLPGNLLNQQGQMRPYKAVDGMIVETKGNQKMLVGVLSSASGTIVVPEDVTEIGNYAFSDNNKITQVIINNDGIKVGSHIFKNSSIDSVYFLGKNAYIQSNTFDNSNVKVQIAIDYIDSYKENWKLIDNQIAEQLQEFTSNYVNVNGFECMETVNDEGKWTIILLNAPANIVEFTKESVPGIEIDEIGENAFSECKSLQYVELDEHVSKIDVGAFKGCTSLEGIISFNTEQITIGNEAFDTNESVDKRKIKSLVFNAQKAIFEDDYIPYQSYSLLYAPYGSEGYPLMTNGKDNCRKYSFKYFVDNVYGGHIIYGETIAIDTDDNRYTVPDQYYLIGATSNVSGEIETRNNIFEICKNAFANCPITSIQLHMTEEKYYIDEGAFYNTNLAGEFVLPNGLCEIGFTAFSKTQITRFVFPQKYANKENLYGQERINIGTYLFDETDTLKEIIFQNEEPINFTLYTLGNGFRFKSNEDDFKIILTGNAQGKEQEYCDAWKYGYVGVTNEDELNDIIDDNAFYYVMDYMGEDDFFDNYEYYYSLAIQQAQQDIDNELEGLKAWFGDALEQPESPSEELPSNPDEDDPSNDEENNLTEDNDSKEDQENQDDNQQSDDQIVEDEGE